jgi:hypothetical protein
MRKRYTVIDTDICQNDASNTIVTGTERMGMQTMFF